MALSRRNFLKLGGLAAAGSTVSACSAASRYVARRQLPETLTLAEPSPGIDSGPGDTVGTGQQPSPAVDPLWRLLNRAGYGPRPGELEAAREMGAAAWLAWQLEPETIEDTAADLFSRSLTLYHMDPDQLLEQERRDAAGELLAATVMRAVLSRRQLYEVMVEFWSDHFNIYLGKNRFQVFLKIVDDRDVIRPHALGRFSDLLRASAQSPAMLVYLDNVRNVRGNPNENYARELMELHTLGVDGGYTQQDVMELARALTGLGVYRRGRQQGRVHFNDEQHDRGEKVILGRAFPAGQSLAQDLDQVLDLLAGHESTASFICTKLIRRFVADDPPPDMVDRVAAVFRQSGGEIKTVLEAILGDPALATAPAKLKRPYTYFVSALRALGVDLDPLSRGRRELFRWLEQLGQAPFQWPPPNGYPDVAPAWAGNLLPRWNFGLALALGQSRALRLPLDRLSAMIDSQDEAALLDLFAVLTSGQRLPATLRPFYIEYLSAGNPRQREKQLRLREAVALMLTGPTFQWT